MKIFAFPKHWCQMAYITASLLRTPTNRTNHFNCMAMRYSRKNNKKNKRNREDGNKGNRGNPKRLAVQHKFTQWVAYSFSSRWSHGLYQEWFNSFPGTSNEFYQHPQGFTIQADRPTHTEPIISLQFSCCYFVFKIETDKHVNIFFDRIWSQQMTNFNRAFVTSEMLLFFQLWSYVNTTENVCKVT